MASDPMQFYRRLDVARRALDRALDERAEAIRHAAAEGLSLREIGAAVGLSHQRVAQIIRGE